MADATYSMMGNLLECVWVSKLMPKQGGGPANFHPSNPAAMELLKQVHVLKHNERLSMPLLEPHRVAEQAQSGQRHFEVGPAEVNQLNTKLKAANVKYSAEFHKIAKAFSNHRLTTDGMAAFHMAGMELFESMVLWQECQSFQKASWKERDNYNTCSWAVRYVTELQTSHFEFEHGSETGQATLSDRFLRGINPVDHASLELERILFCLGLSPAAKQVHSANKYISLKKLFERFVEAETDLKFEVGKFNKNVQARPVPMEPSKYTPVLKDLLKKAQELKKAAGDLLRARQLAKTYKKLGPIAIDWIFHLLKDKTEYDLRLELGDKHLAALHQNPHDSQQAPLEKQQAFNDAKKHYLDARQALAPTGEVQKLKTVWEQKADILLKGFVQHQAVIAARNEPEVYDNTILLQYAEASR